MDNDEEFVWWREIDRLKSKIHKNTELLKVFTSVVEHTDWTELIQLPTYFYIFRELSEDLGKIIEIEKTHELS